MSWAWARRGFVLSLVIVVGLGCERPSARALEREAKAAAHADAAASEDAPAPDPPPLVIEFAGCDRVANGPVCALGEGRTLRVFVASRFADRIHWRFDERTIVAEPGLRDDEGTAYTLALPGNDGWLTAEDPDTHGGFRLRVVPIHVDPDVLRLADRAYEGDAGVEAELLQRLPALSPSARTEGLLLVMRIRYRAKQWEPMLAAASEAFTEATRAGEPSLAVDAAAIAMYVLSEILMRYEDAQAWVERIEPSLPGHAEGRAQIDYSAGLLARKRAQWTHALDRFVAADTRARRLGLDRLRAEVLPLLALLLLQAGRVDEAERVSDEAVAISQSQSPCLQAATLNTIGALRIGAWEWGVKAPSPDPLLQQAVGLSEEDGACPDRARWATAAVNLAHARVLAGDGAGAKAWLGRAREHVVSPFLAVVAAELELRAELARGRGDPGRALARFVELAARDPDPEVAWRVALREGEVARARGHHDEALAAFERAEQLLDGIVARLALGLERDRFAHELHKSSHALIDLELERGRPEAALCHARLARSRSLRTIDLAERLQAARERAEPYRDAYMIARAEYDAAVERTRLLPALELEAERRRLFAEVERQWNRVRSYVDTVAASDPDGRRCPPLPAADEALVLALPRGPGFTVFVADASGIRVEHTGELPRPLDAAGLARVLAPLGTLPESVTRLRLLLSGELVRARIHAMPWRGEPLGQRFAIAYGLDLPPSGDASPAVPPRARALIVGDPTRELSAASSNESSGIAEALRAREIEVDVLAGDEAERKRVVAALERARLFHFSGHADAAADAPEGQRALRLAGSSAFGIGDVLTLANVPVGVFLNGCGTGIADPYAVAGGFNLAHAFLARGASWVVATDADVDNESAALIGRTFYDHYEGDPATALRRTRRALEGRVAPEALDGFRVWTRS